MKAILNSFLILNQSSNLAKDCVSIDQTTDWLPLNLTFRQISLKKMANFLRQRDLEESFGGPNLAYEDAVRAKRIESNFETNGFFSDRLGIRSILLFLLIKSCMQIWGNWRYYQATNSGPL